MATTAALAAQTTRDSGAARRRVRRPLGLLLLAVSLLVCGGPDSPEEDAASLTRSVRAFVDASQGTTGGAYRRPPAAASRDLAGAVSALADGRRTAASELAIWHSYQLIDEGQFVVLAPEQVPDARGWGMYAIRPGGHPIAIEVPHPRADRRTEALGAALAERLGAEYLLVAGARRDSDGGRADVAHQVSSVFSTVHARLAERGVPAVQVHGFAQDSSPGNDIVVSPGAARLSPLVEQVADSLQEAGFRTCRAWQENCGRLEGRSNVQSVASADSDTTFVHVEVSSSVRDDRDARRVLVTALAAAVTTAVPASGE